LLHNNTLVAWPQHHWLSFDQEIDQTAK